MAMGAPLVEFSENGEVPVNRFLECGDITAAGASIFVIFTPCVESRSLRSPWRCFVWSRYVRMSFYTHGECGKEGRSRGWGWKGRAKGDPRAMAHCVGSDTGFVRIMTLPGLLQGDPRSSLWMATRNWRP